MNDVAILRGTEPRKILQTAIDKNTPAVMSYQSRGTLHTAKVLLAGIGANRLDIQLVPKKRPSNARKARKKTRPKTQPVNIKVNQEVEISLKYGYGNFVFSTTVIEIELPSKAPADHIRQRRQVIAVIIPDRIEIVQKRNFFRVSVPDSLKVNVTMWHRDYTDKQLEEQIETQVPNPNWTPPENHSQGRLIDISAGGMQIVVEAEKKPDFKTRQFISLRFTPMPYETPLMLNAQIRNIQQTADQKSICFGLKIVGVKSGRPDHQILGRLCNIAEHYHKINQYSTKQQDFQTTSIPR